MNAVIDAYHAACARIMLTYDGFIGDFRGDGILAYFGYPRAHEDDAERTARAGLDIEMNSCTSTRKGPGTEAPLRPPVSEAIFCVSLLMVVPLSAKSCR
jgi:class 3 adenylate cyclase